MRVLISHSPAHDGDFSETLANRLWKIGVEPRRDVLKSPQPSTNFDRLDQELRKYDFMIPILSAGYMRDKWLQTELFQGMVRERTDKVTFVLPILIGNSKYRTKGYKV